MNNYKKYENIRFQAPYTIKHPHTHTQKQTYNVLFLFFNKKKINCNENK